MRQKPCTSGRNKLFGGTSIRYSASGGRLAAGALRLMGDWFKWITL